eukprot:6675317-Alexandrium_andersonii.AAC.1
MRKFWTHFDPWHCAHFRAVAGASKSASAEEPPHGPVDPGGLLQFRALIKALEQLAGSAQ